jgi:hypothetical protein
MFRVLVGVSKRFRTEPVTEYTIIFVIGHCYPLASLYKVGPVFLPLLEIPLQLTEWNRVYEKEYAIFTEFQGRRGSDALVAAIPFSETSSSHRGAKLDERVG